MKTLEIESLHGISICHSITVSCREIFNPLTYKFETGKVYCITTKEHNSLASWALASALGGRMEEDYNGTIYLDGIVVNQRALQEKACFVADDRVLLPKYEITEKFNVYNFDYNRFLVNEHFDDRCACAKDIIERALAESKSDHSLESIKQKFKLSDERLVRDIRFVSNEIWLISIAIGYAEGRSIFIFPLIDLKNASIINGLDNIIEELKQDGKMIIIPVMNMADIHLKCNAIINTGIGSAD